MKQLTIGLLLTLVGLPASAWGQDVAAKGQVTAGAHELDMKAGHIYLIKVDAKGFVPNVAMTPARLPFIGQDFNKPNVFQSHYMPSKDEKNTILIVPVIFDLKGKGPFEYEIEVKSAALAAKPILDVKGELTKEDPAFKAEFTNRAHHKSFELKVKANQFYVIDMRTPEKSDLDDYLYLLDSTGKIVMSDDDSGGFPHARIVFRAPKDGDYRIIATGLGDALGRFDLTVRTTEAK